MAVRDLTSSRFWLNSRDPCNWLRPLGTSSRESEPSWKSMRPRRPGLVRGPCASTWKVVFPLAVRSGSSVSGTFKLIVPLAVKSSGCLSLRARLPWTCRAVSSPVPWGGSRWRRALGEGGMETDEGRAERGVAPPLAFEVNAGHSDRQLIEACLAAQRLGPRQRSLDGDRSGQRGLPAEALNVGQFEEGGDVEAREIEFGLGGKVAGEGGRE